jgi:hypothetical protein
LNIPGGGYNPNNKGSGRSLSSDSVTPGGFASGGGGFGFGSGDKNKEELQKYLPGGEKDPNQVKKGVGPEGITAPGGLTLFEKVTKSYRNNRSSLIPE